MPGDGKWTDAVRERYADRVEAILTQHIDGFRALVLGRRVYAPSDLETLNTNLTGGDPYGGFCGIDQSFLWRPFKEASTTAPISTGFTTSAHRPIPAPAWAAARDICWPSRCADRGIGGKRER